MWKKASTTGGNGGEVSEEKRGDQSEGERGLEVKSDIKKKIYKIVSVV